MHIDQAKDNILKSLKSLGFKPYSVFRRNGDFRIFLAQKKKSIQIMVLNGSELRNILPTRADEICSSVEGGCEVNHKDGRSYFSNSAWEVTERTKRGINPDTTILPPATNENHCKNPVEDKTETENKKDGPMSDNLHEDFNTELKRLGMTANRLETILDEFVLHRMAMKELLGKLYEGLKKEGVEVYTTKAQIQISGNSFVIPHLNKENFIEIGVRSIKKDL